MEQVEDTIKINEIQLTEDEIKLLEEVAATVKVSTIRGWEKSMV